MATKCRGSNTYATLGRSARYRATAVPPRSRPAKRRCCDCKLPMSSAYLLEHPDAGRCESCTEAAIARADARWAARAANASSQALTELRTWRQRYADLPEFTPVFAVIDQLEGGEPTRR